MRKGSIRRLRSITLIGAMGVLALSCAGGDEGAALAMPGDFKAIWVPGPAGHLTWKDTSSAEDHFVIERKTGAGAFVEHETEPLNAVQHHDGNVTPGTTYVYRVAAVGAKGEKSPYTAEIAVNIP